MPLFLNSCLNAKGHSSGLRDWAVTTLTSHANNVMQDVIILEFEQEELTFIPDIIQTLAAVLYLCKGQGLLNKLLTDYRIVVWPYGFSFPFYRFWLDKCCARMRFSVNILLPGYFKAAINQWKGWGLYRSCWSRRWQKLSKWTRFPRRKHVDPRDGFQFFSILTSQVSSYGWVSDISLVC